MIEASCHCGAVRMEVPRAPEVVTQCRCSICHKLGVTWAYYPPKEVRFAAGAGETLEYTWNKRVLVFHTCKHCGCTTHWSAVDPARGWMAVNARLMPVEVLEAAAVRVIEGPEGGIAFNAPCPVLRMFDVAKAREFYVDFLGFSWDWEHRFEPDAPVYAQVSRAGLRLHLSEHHGDGSPGAVFVAPMTGVHAYQKELAGKIYRYYRPSVQSQPWGDEMSVIDPSGNRIRFTERPEG